MEEEYKGYTIKIEIDEDPLNPRGDENLGKMICFHNNYELGDKHNYNSDDFTGWEELKNKLVSDGAVAISPLYLYDHSGLRIKIGSFYGLLPQGHAEFDSGQVGFIVAFKEDVEKWFDTKRITKKVIQKVEDNLKAEVETYDKYISGQVYSYIVEGLDEIGDSCWGFYDTDEAIQEAKNVIDSHIEEEQRKREAKTKAYISHNVPLINRI